MYVGCTDLRERCDFVRLSNLPAVVDTNIETTRIEKNPLLSK